MTTSPTTGAETISDDPSKDLISLIAGISSQQITRTILFASWTLFLYDHALVFDAEVERIWKARWTPVKCAYVAMRVCNLTFLVGNIHRAYYFFTIMSVQLVMFHSDQVFSPN